MICSKKKLTALGCTLLLTSAFTELAYAVPAFPGAEGSAAEAVGGRGGRVIEVTNLNSSGPGSFREACEAEGPRIVVFKVAGVIDLEGERIKIKNPYITIAGQTAPEGGITIKGHELGIQTHDVIVRFIKIRTGYNPDFGDQEGDAVGIDNAGVYNTIINHVSMSWAKDENAQIWTPPLMISPFHGISSLKVWTDIVLVLLPAVMKTPRISRMFLCIIIFLQTRRIDYR